MKNVVLLLAAMIMAILTFSCSDSDEENVSPNNENSNKKATWNDVATEFQNLEDSKDRMVKAVREK